MPIWQKTEEELGRMNVPPPWWAFAWAGGQALARYVLDNPALVAGPQRARPRRRLGPRRHRRREGWRGRVLAADIDPFALAAMALNADANGVAIETTGADLLAAPPAAFGLVLVGDLFYERPLAERALAFIEAARDRGAACSSAIRGAAISPRTASGRSPNIRCP